MPTITVNRKVLAKIIGKKLSESQLKDRISMLGTDLESVDENEIVVEIFPNRPDMLSEQGFGRALASFVGHRTGLREYKTKPSGIDLYVDKNQHKVRPFTACAILKNLHLDDDKIKELMNIQEKLHGTFCRNRKKAAMGIYPMEKIKPPIYFSNRKPKDIIFRPLEWPEEINALQILQKHPTGREYAHLVEGMDRFAIFVDSAGHILSFTPIINSHMTGKITEDTREAFIEVSGYDFEMCRMLLNIMVCTLADMGAEIYSMKLHYPDKVYVSPDLKPKEWKLDLAYVNKHLGFDLKENEMKKYLEQMGFGYSKGVVKVPAYRADIMHPIDFTEDIAIAYGYENVEPEIPSISTIGNESRTSVFRNRVADILIGLGLLECNTLHLINKEKQTRWMNHDIPVIDILKSVSKEHDSVRSWILPLMMEVLSSNRHNEYPQKIFTMGRVFIEDKNMEPNVREDLHLSIVSIHKDADYTEIKQYLDYLFRMIDVEYKTLQVEHSSFIPGRAAKVVVDKKEIGFLGEVHPLVLNNFELGMPACALEIDLTGFIK